VSKLPASATDAVAAVETSAAAAAARPLTRRKTGRTLGGMFLPYQLAWINDAAPRKLGDKSRRTGWTYSEAYDCVSKRFRKTARRDMDYWFSSADESAAQEYIEYCRFFAKDLFGVVADQFTDQIEDPETKRVATAFCVRTPGGKKIVAMSSNPRRFRSKGGDVCLDEYAFHDDPRGMYTAASPVTTWGGDLRVFSTHNGETCEFNKFVQKCRKVIAVLCGGSVPEPLANPHIPFETMQATARAMNIAPIFSYHRVTIVDAIEQGIVELINDTRGTTWTREAFLADCREKSLDSDAFAQEYMCVPSADATAWLSFALIESCESADCPAIDAALPADFKLEAGSIYVGIDVGRKKDLTVVWILQRVGDVLWTRRVVRLAKMTLPSQVEAIAFMLRPLRPAAALVDQTGIGLGLCEGLALKLGGVQGVTFTGPAKQAIAVDIKGAFEDRGVRIPTNDGSLRDSLHKVRKTVTATGLIRFEADRDDAGHADEFWGLGLAVHAAKQLGGGISGPIGVQIEHPLKRWEGLP